MKKLLLASAILFSLSSLRSQVVFCPPGAEWNYLFNYDLSTMSANETIRYIGDAIVDGDSVKILNHSKFFSRINMGNYGPTYIKQKGDTVFMKNVRTMSKWQILYNFAALTGHYWTNSLIIANGDTINYKVTVTGVNTVTVNSMSLKELSVDYRSDYNNNSIYSTTKITERMGCARFLFNFMSRAVSDGDYFSMNLCYKDNVFGLKQNTTLACNASNPTGLNVWSSENGLFTAYPNPFTNEVTLTGVMEGKLILLNSLGEDLKVETTSDGERTKVDLGGLANGIYFIRSGDQTLKVLKQ